MSRGGNIIDMLHDCEVSQFGKIHESSIKEDKWKTMHGAHILVDSENNIKAGGPKEFRKPVDAESSKVKKRDMKDYDDPECLKDLRNNSETAKKYGFLKSGKDRGRLDDNTFKDDIDKKAAIKFIDDMADKYDDGRSGKPSVDEIECMKALVRNNALSKEDKDFVKTNFLGM